jgi:hypothetical protein
LSFVFVDDDAEISAAVAGGLIEHPDATKSENNSCLRRILSILSSGIMEQRKASLALIGHRLRQPIEAGAKA